MTALRERWVALAARWSPGTRFAVQALLLLLVAASAAAVLDVGAHGDGVRVGVAAAPWLVVSGPPLHLDPHLFSAAPLGVLVGGICWRALRLVTDAERTRVAFAAVWIGLVAMALVEGAELATAIVRLRGPGA